MVKTTGKLFNEFYHDDAFWPEDAFLDDYLVRVNGEELAESLLGCFEAEDEIFIESGTVFLSDDQTLQLEDYFTKWQSIHHPQNFTGAELDVIFKLVKFGPCGPGDVPSKSGVISLVERKLVSVISGPSASLWYGANPELFVVFNEHFKGR